MATEAYRIVEKARTEERLQAPALYLDLMYGQILNIAFEAISRDERLTKFRSFADLREDNKWLHLMLEAGSTDAPTSFRKFKVGFYTREEVIRDLHYVVSEFAHTNAPTDSYIVDLTRFAPKCVIRSKLESHFKVPALGLEDLSRAAEELKFNGEDFVRFATPRFRTREERMPLINFYADIALPFIYSLQTGVLQWPLKAEWKPPLIRREQIRISLPPRPSAAPTIKLPQPMHPPKLAE